MTDENAGARTTSVRKRIEGIVPPLAHSVTSVHRRIQPVTGVVTTLGWSVFAFGIACWVVGWQCGWTELMVLAVAAWLLLALCVLLVLGRARLSVKLAADPQRVVVGSPAAGSVAVTNIAKGLMLPIGLELPIGPGVARFAIPALRPGSEYEELFIVPTERRGVVVVGPERTVRGDPLGLLQKMVSWTESLEVYVHPVTVPLQPLGSGLLRDLEGQTTEDLSNSDLAFHALREYQPGDDRRFIHWRSSAKLSRAHPSETKFLVRQFQDTRRSHICVVVDSALASYPDPEDYEMAISTAASITLRALSDEHQVSIFAGHAVAPGAQGNRILDVFARAELKDARLAELARHGARMTPDASTAVLITGRDLPFQDLQRAANEFPFEVRAVALQIDPSRPTGIRGAGGLSVLSLQKLADLAGLLQGSLQ